MKMVDITCSKCGAMLKPNFKKKRAVCEYCGSAFFLVHDTFLEEITPKTEAQVTKVDRKGSIKILLLLLMISVFIGAFSLVVMKVSESKVDTLDYISESSHETDEMDVSVPYLDTLDNLSAEDLAKLHKKAEETLDDNLRPAIDQGYFIEMKPVKLFLTTGGKQLNRLYDVFEAHFNTRNGEVVYYVWAYFDGVRIQEDGGISLQDAITGYAGYPALIQGPVCIIGYDSMEQVEVEIGVTVRGEMELKVLDL